MNATEPFHRLLTHRRAFPPSRLAQVQKGRQAGGRPAPPRPPMGTALPLPGWARGTGHSQFFLILLLLHHLPCNAFMVRTFPGACIFQRQGHKHPLAGCSLTYGTDCHRASRQVPFTPPKGIFSWRGPTVARCISSPSHFIQD